MKLLNHFLLLDFCVGGLLLTTLCVLGLIGNSLTLYVLNASAEMRRQPINTYLTVLAVYDNGVLFNAILMLGIPSLQRAQLLLMRSSEEVPQPIEQRRRPPPETISDEGKGQPNQSWQIDLQSTWKSMPSERQVRDQNAIASLSTLLQTRLRNIVCNQSDSTNESKLGDPITVLIKTQSGFETNETDTIMKANSSQVSSATSRLQSKRNDEPADDEGDKENEEISSRMQIDLRSTNKAWNESASWSNDALELDYEMQLIRSLLLDSETGVKLNQYDRNRLCNRPIDHAATKFERNLKGKQAKAIEPAEEEERKDENEEEEEEEEEVVGEAEAAEEDEERAQTGDADSIELNRPNVIDSDRFAARAIKQRAAQALVFTSESGMASEQFKFDTRPTASRFFRHKSSAAFDRGRHHSLDKSIEWLVDFDPNPSFDQQSHSNVADSNANKNDRNVQDDERIRTPSDKSSSNPNKHHNFVSISSYSKHNRTDQSNVSTAAYFASMPFSFSTSSPSLSSSSLPLFQYLTQASQSLSIVDESSQTNQSSSLNPLSLPQPATVFVLDASPTQKWLLNVAKGVSDWLQQHMQIIYPLALTSQTASIWTTCLITVERYLAVCHPFRALSLSTRSRAVLSLLLLSAAAFLYNLPRFAEISVSGSGDHVQVQKTSLRSSLLYYWFYYIFLNLALIYVLPLTLLSYLNTQIYFAVRDASKNRSTLTRYQESELNIATMLLLVVAVFIGCNMPGFVVTVMELCEAPYMQVLTIFSNVLVCVNSSTNFVIYSIFGKKFRAKLKEAFSCNVRVNRHEMQRNNTLMSAAPTALSGVHATVGPTPTAGSSGVVTLPVRNVDKRSPSSPNVITPDLHRSANHVTSRVCRTSITRPLLARLRCASLDSCGDSLAKHSTHFELRHSFIDHQQQSSSKPTDDQNETRRTRSDHRSSVLDMTHLENDHFEMGADSSSSTITTERTSHLHCKDENGFGNKAIVRHSDNIVSQHHQHHSADSNCIDEATRHNLNNNNTLPFADEYVINCNLCAQKCKERVQKETFV